MISFVILFVIFVILLRTFGDFFLRVVISAIISLMILFVVTVIINPEREKVYKHIKLHSIQDNFGVSGNFFLFSANLSETPKYRFYYEVSNGKYHLGEYDANNSTICYTDEQPKMEWHYLKLKNKNYNWWLFDLSNSSCDKNEVTFYIPRGSIANEYKLDLND